MIATKLRKCKVCKAPYEQRQSFSVWCSPACGSVLALQRLAKIKNAAKTIERKEDQVKREKLKNKADWAREAQTAFNAWIRARDVGRPCISCGRHHQGQYHAGHYLSVGARPELRFEPLNVWKQCAPCNTHLSGNAVLFRVALVREIGIDKVEWLEGHHDPKRYTVEDLKGIKKHYVAALRELKAEE